MDKLAAFIRFCRPHTIIATSLQVTGLFILAASGAALGLNALAVFLLGLASSLATNIYIVGLNQLVDVDIDRVNKPRLPLAAGDLSMRQGRWLVGIVALTAVGIALTQGPWLLLTVVLGMIVGTLYSLPPWHLKSRPVWAALSIAFVRGIVVNFGLFLHFHTVLQPDAEIPWLVVSGLALFFFGFGLVIAVYKDIPDQTGDRQFGIRTFTVRLGPRKVFESGRWLFTAFYLIPVAAALIELPGLNGWLLLAAQFAMLAVFWRASWRVDPAEPAAVTRFYMFLWALFYVQYILLSLNTVISAEVLI